MPDKFELQIGWYFFSSLHFIPLNRIQQRKKLTYHRINCFIAIYIPYPPVRVHCVIQIERKRTDQQQQPTKKKRRGENDFPIHSIYLLMNKYSFACHCIVDWFTRTSMRGSFKLTHNKIEHGLLCLLKIHQFNTNSISSSNRSDNSISSDDSNSSNI